MPELKDYEMFHSRSKFEKSLNTLKGILQGISIDSAISDKEINELINWCTLQAEHIERQPYSELIPLINQALADGNLTENECQDILWVCNNFICENKYYDYITASIQQLHGIIHGVLADNRIDDKEVLRLAEWVGINNFLSGTYPYDELESLLATILADKRVDDLERMRLKAFLGEFVDTRSSFNINLPELEELRAQIQISGICALHPSVVFDKRNFCFTGESKRAGRKEIASVVISRNGFFTNNVTQRTNYLVVGNNGNPCWAFSCYGRKVESAIELRKQGIPITIVNEDDFWGALN